MDWVDLELAGLKLLSPKIFGDERGYFFESYRQPLYAQAGISEIFVQDNVSFSRKDSVRGLHFQEKPGQAKLVSCLQGMIWDVAVDIRPGSETFGKWTAVELDDIRCKQLYVPVGFAHGFCVLSETAKVCYKVSALYDPKTERAIRWNDPDLKVAWPVQNPVLSPRDQASPFFKEVFHEVMGAGR